MSKPTLQERHPNYVDVVYTPKPRRRGLGEMKPRRRGFTSTWYCTNYVDVVLKNYVYVVYTPKPRRQGLGEM